MKARDYILYAALGGLLVLTGCFTRGPDYKKPDLGIEVEAGYQYSPAEKAIAIPEERWWELFGDPDLNRLVDEALEHNWEIRRAAARVLEIRSQLVRTRADRYPRLDLQAGYQKQRRSVTTLAAGAGGITRKTSQQTIDTHSLSLPASFELDVWGRLARAEEAVKADLLQARETRHTVAQTVAAETITLYLQVESLERRIAIAEERIANYRRSLALVEGRYKRGLTSILDVRQAKRLLSGAEAELPARRQELGVAQQRLSILVGRYPQTTPPRSQPEEYFARLAPVPAELPSDLLARRPDIRAAEARLKALNALVGAAEAARFPRITLTASFGYSSDDLSDLFEPQSRLWKTAAGLVQPLFDAGRLKAGQKAAEARYQQGVAEYARTVLNAFFEVERALLTRKEQLQRRERVIDFLEQARATQQVAEKRYFRGLVDYLTVLEATQTRFQAAENLVLVDLAILQNRVSLHRSLGGGWAGSDLNSIKRVKGIERD